jgi:predicted DCC family thiol-disulfide oxidoreductase YuxK
MCHYADYARGANLPIAFDDLTRTDLTAWAVTEDAATRLLHVLHQGQLHVGFDAFLVLWDQLPRYRWAARVCRTPGLYQVLDWGYVNIAARYIYRRHLRRKARGQVRPGRRVSPD